MTIKQDKTNKMMDRIVDTIPVGKFVYIDNIKIDLLIPIQRKQTALMILFDRALNELIIARRLNLIGNRVSLKQ